MIEDLVVKNAFSFKSVSDMAPLIEKIKDKKIVMLGEATHGTHEFYEWRRLISQELIEKHGFNFIAVEGDWPPCSALNEFIRSDTKTVRQTLGQFKRWPSWIWANTEVIKLAQWLQDHNRNKSIQEAGFYGLDIYSLYESIDEIIDQLLNIDPDLAANAKKHYECFDPYRHDENLYARSLWEFPEGCRVSAVKALQELLEVRLNECSQIEKLFDIQQNARIVKNAEDYYNTMIHGDEDSWNVRDRHMMETLNILLEHCGSDSKAIVWAHNTHIGDYRATDMVREGQINLGGLARQEWGHKNVALIGFGTYEGEVIASRKWNDPFEVMRVPPAQLDSYEKIFHNACETLNVNSIFLWLPPHLIKNEFTKPLGHRAIGVIYHPDYERRGNYVPTTLSHHYDGFIFIDQTNALVPLDLNRRSYEANSESPMAW